jgi:predicted nucleic acid-binding protein
MIHLDTCVLVDALTGTRRSLPALRRLVDSGQRLGCSAIVSYEWRRGPRTSAELHVQEAILPAEAATPFGVEEASLAATLYRQVKRPRGREIDLAIAACAIAHDAVLWTLNPSDFVDVPGLHLAEPPKGL